MTPQGAFAELARGGGRGALVTVLAGAEPGAKLFVGADRATQGTLGDPFWGVIGMTVDEPLQMGIPAG